MFLSYIHRQTVAGKTLRLLRQWHRPRKDLEAFIQILPTEYTHLHTSSTLKRKRTEKKKKEARTGVVPNSIKQRNSLSHRLASSFEILKTTESFSARTFEIQKRGFTIKLKKKKKDIDWEFVQISHYNQRAGVYLFTHNVFTRSDEMMRQSRSTKSLVQLHSTSQPP